MDTRLLSLLKDIIQLVVRQRVRHSLHFHPDFNLMIFNFLVNPAENLKSIIIDNGYTIGKILFKSDRAVFQLTESHKLAGSGNLEPLYMVTVGYYQQ